MAEMILTHAEAVSCVLPRVCVVCGEPAGRFRARMCYRRWTWVYVAILGGFLVWVWLALGARTPPGVLLAYPAVVVVGCLLLHWRRHLRVCLPFCPLHFHYWTWRDLLLTGMLYAVGIVLAVGSMLALETGRWPVAERPTRFSELEWEVFKPLVVLSLLLITGVVLTALLRLLAPIRVKALTRTTVTVVGVAAEFAEALRVRRGAGVRSADEADRLRHGDDVARKLLELIATRGVAVCEEWQRCAGLLYLACPEHGLLAEALVTALRRGVVGAVLSSPEGPPWARLYLSLVEGLERDTGMGRPTACWCVNAWMAALRPHVAPAGVQPAATPDAHGIRIGPPRNV
jgi:hypothetical protein